jgi:hypothetical protein
MLLHRRLPALLGGVRRCLFRRQPFRFDGI